MFSQAVVESIRAGVAVALCGVAGWYDVSTGRIPNRLTYGGTVIGLGLAAVTSFEMLGWHLLAVAAGFGLLIVFWQWGMLGGGDVKLAMMIGAIQGGWFLLHFLLYIFIFALVAVLFISIQRIGVLRTAGFVGSNLLSMLLLRSFPDTPEELRRVQIPFGLIACVAVSLCILLRSRGLLELPVVTLQ